MIGEGNFVGTQSEVLKEGKAWAVYEIFKIKDSRILRPWLVEQAIPDNFMHSNGMF